MKTQRRDGLHEPIRRRLPRFALLLFALSLLPVSPSPHLPVAFTTGAERVTTATREGRLAVFDEVWTTLRARYYDPQLHGVDWPTQRTALRPLAAEADSPAAFYAVLRRMLGSLRDAHTRVYSPEERSDWQRTVYPSVGVSAREIAGEVIVTNVERNSEAWRAGVRAGDAVTSIDGEAVMQKLARRLAEESSASTVQAARLQATVRLFDGPLDAPVSVTFTRGEGKRSRTVSLRRTLRTREPALDFRREDGIAIARFNLFTQEIAVELLRMLEREEMQRARGLVIDLRDNGGGETEAMTDIASAFLPLGTNLGRFIDRDGNTTSAPQTRPAMLLTAAANIKNFPHPIVVLTGARTSSAAEIFAAALQAADRADLIIGEPTCGCVLGIRRRHPLPDGGLLDISEMDFRTARDTRLEGTGVTPDEQLAPSKQDIRAGHDPALKRATDFLRAKGKRQQVTVEESEPRDG
ncbi:MAG: S41 family peptidase [Acidobacteriota bacterium]|nr:S41 family peptidase [Acidobacteriota bacterium]